MARKDNRLPAHMADASPSGIVPLLGMVLLVAMIVAVVALLF